MTSSERTCPAWIRSLCLPEAVSAPYQSPTVSRPPPHVRARFRAVLPLFITPPLLLRTPSSPLLPCQKRSGAAATLTHPSTACRLEPPSSACTPITTTSQTRKYPCHRSLCSLSSPPWSDMGWTLLPLRTLPCLNLLHRYPRRKADTVSIRVWDFLRI